MATRTATEPAEEKLVRIEDFAAGTDPAVYAAIREMRGWQPGKSVTEGQWRQAVDDFLHAAAGATPRR